MATDMNQPLEIVIIGLGAGGLYASKAALSFNRKCRVTFIEKRDFDQFSPCGLPFVIEGVVKDFEALKYNVPEVKNRLIKLLHHEAVSVDHQKKIVRAVDLATSEEKAVSYDGLILATGASPITLPIPGAEEFLGRGIHFVSDIENSRALLEAARSSRKKHAVVVGAGAAGLEVAVALRRIGLDVAMTKRTPPPFPRNLDPEMGQTIVEHLESLGIRVLFGKGIDRINGSREVESVEIDGETIPCDIVVMAVGMRGNTKIAEGVGATTEKGLVKVNNRMETSVKGVYAIGDLVRTYSRIDRTPATMQLATSAYRQGMTAGINAAGGDTPYPGALNTFLTVVRGLEIASTGYTLQTAKDLGYDARAVSTRREIRPHYMPDVTDINLRVIVDADDGKILGAQAVGREGAGWRINLFALAIHGGMTLYDLQDAELSYNPPVSQMYDPVSQVAEVGLKRLKLPPKTCNKDFFPSDRDQTP
ncbi:MAG: FAD-dependent oxidoreductase [Proteobacteria bacterium]|nr:FAD-dependent oxidoreductase [Pseudomonadota bacterium]MBU1904222.1 FAD-dependent oxidoreductase [Pseudomonadota bacterium]